MIITTVYWAAAMDQARWSVLVIGDDVEFCQQPFQPSTVQFSRSVVSDSLRPHESQHARPPCPSPTPGVHSDSCPSNQWCRPAISSWVVPFSSCPQSLPALGSFPMSQLLALLVSGVQQSDSVIYLCRSIFCFLFSVLFHIVPCAIHIYSKSSLFVYFIYGSVHLFIPHSQFVTHPPPLTIW